MVNILIHSRTLAEHLFNPDSSVDGLDYSWNILGEQSHIKAYVYERGLEAIRRDVCYWKNEKVADETIFYIHQSLIVCPIDRETMSYARNLNAPFDAAQEVACAIKNGINAILTKTPEDFRTLGLRHLSPNEWLSTRLYPSFRSEAESLVIVLGGLQEIQRISEFVYVETESDEIVNMQRWNQNVFDEDWRSFEDLGIKKQLDFTPRGFLCSSSVSRGKLLNLGVNESMRKVILLLTCKKSSPLECNLQVGLFPNDIDAHLPKSIKLEILDRLKLPIMQAHSGLTNSIQLNFSGEEGEYFSIRIMLGCVSHTERFII